MERAARMIVRLIGFIMLLIAFYIGGNFPVAATLGALSFVLIMLS
jgi:hypothetical protein